LGRRLWDRREQIVERERERERDKSNYEMKGN